RAGRNAAPGRPAGQSMPRPDDCGPEGRATRPVAAIGLGEGARSACNLLERQSCPGARGAESSHSDRIQRQGEGPRAKSRSFALAALTVNESDCHINCFFAGRTSSLTEAGLLQKSLNLLPKSV